MLKRVDMRQGIAMIELIFAIVIIAISVLAIPSMMAIANSTSKGAIVDDDVLSRLSGWLIDKSQARWDGNYSASGSGPLWIGTADLNCSRGAGNVWYRVNTDSNIQCNDQNLSPQAIQANYSDGNLSKGIERLNGGSEMIAVTASTGETYNVNATYSVRYVSSDYVSLSGNTETATWRLGSSTNMSPDGSTATATHLKRVVTRFNSPGLGVDTTLTFFKSNKGN